MASVIANVQNPKQTLGEQAYQEMRRQILHGELAPGDSLSERTLVQRLSVGQAAVRVAVQRLATQGFVSVQPRRGIVVTPQSIQDVIDLFEVRLMIEQRVARALAGNLTSVQVEGLRDCVTKMVRAANDGDHSTVVEADFAFHRSLCELYGNRPLLSVLDRILDGLYREVWSMRTKYPWQSDDVWEMHEGIINCLQFGDAAQAEQLLADHLRAGEQRVLSRKPPPAR